MSTHREKQLNLDVNGFLKLSIDNSLKLNLYKPFQKETITLSSLPLKRLKKMFKIFLMEEAIKEFLIVGRQIFNQQPKILLLEASNDKQFQNNKYGNVKMG